MRSRTPSSLLGICGTAEHDVAAADRPLSRIRHQDVLVERTALFRTLTPASVQASHGERDEMCWPLVTGHMINKGQSCLSNEIVSSESRRETAFVTTRKHQLWIPFHDLFNCLQRKFTKRRVESSRHELSRSPPDS
jgi:hypothetical protein